MNTANKPRPINACEHVDTLMTIYRVIVNKSAPTTYSGCEQQLG